MLSYKKLGNAIADHMLSFIFGAFFAMICSLASMHLVVKPECLKYNRATPKFNTELQNLYYIKSYVEEKIKDQEGL